MARKLPPLSGKAKKIKVNVFIWLADNEQDLLRQPPLLRNRDSQNNVIYPYYFVTQWINTGQAESKFADYVFVTDSTDIGFSTLRIHNQQEMINHINNISSLASEDYRNMLRRFLVCRFLPIGSDAFNEVIQEILNLPNPNEFELGIKNLVLKNL